MGISIYAILPFYLIAVLPFLSGCAGVRPGGPPVASELTGLSWMLQRPPGTVKNLSLKQIRNILGSEHTNFTTLKAKAQITVVTSATNGPLSCNGYLRLQRPNKLRFLGTKLFSTVFDMLTDGERFWLYLPSEKKVYTGSCSSINRLANLDVNMHPKDIAMLLNYNDALPQDETQTAHANSIPILETWPGLWLIHLINLNNETPTLRANLYIDRVGVNVIRYDVFGENGNVSVQALFDDYTRIDNFPIPQSIAIFWPDAETKLMLSLTDIATNEQINPKVFQFSKPKRAEMVFLDDEKK